MSHELRRRSASRPVGDQLLPAEPQPLFDRFWAAYPRKSGKLAARRIFDRQPWAQGRDAISFEEMMFRLDDWKCVLADRNTEDKFIMMPERWLAEHHWADNYAPWRLSTLTIDRAAPEITRVRKFKREHGITTDAEAFRVLLGRALDQAGV